MPADQWVPFLVQAVLIARKSVHSMVFQLEHVDSIQVYLWRSFLLPVLNKTNVSVNKMVILTPGRVERWQICPLQGVPVEHVDSIQIFLPIVQAAGQYRVGRVHPNHAVFTPLSRQNRSLPESPDGIFGVVSGRYKNFRAGELGRADEVSVITAWRDETNIKKSN